MVAKGTTQEDRDEAAAEKAKAAAEKTAEKGRDPDDPAGKPGNTGNAATMSGGIRTEPTEAEDEEAKQQAADAAATSDAMLGEGSYRKASQAEAQAIRDGASMLGKEAVVVQNDQGDPVVARRGMSPATRKASATNPDLMRNDTVAEIPPEPPKAVAKGDTLKKGAKGEEIKHSVPMHGTGGGVAPQG